MSHIIRLWAFALAGILAMGCSGTQVSESWTSPDFKGPVKKIFIIGIAKTDFNRMYFENSFYDKLKSEGVESIPSSTDLPNNEETDRAVIIQKMRANGCDSVLLTRVVDQKTKAVINTGSGAMGPYNYVPGPYYGGVRSYSPPPWYNSWGSYYHSGYTLSGVSSQATSFVVLTVESVMYDLKTEKLIWSAQMQTDKETNFEDMVGKFVDEVARDLRQKGLI